MPSEINYGIKVLNPAPCGAQATIAVTGMGRSGTTMIARILLELGLPMGAPLSPTFLEEEAIVAMLKEGRMDDFTVLCRSRDAEHPKWAFKCPALRLRLAAADAILRKPRYIVPFRDIMAIAQRNHLELGVEMHQALGTAANRYDKFVRALLTLKAPVLTVSYEKALHYPDMTVREVARFCGVKVGKKQAREIGAQTVRNADPRYLGSA